MPRNTKGSRPTGASAVSPAGLREHATFPPVVISEIQRAAREGIYDIRGLGAKRHLPSFDDLIFLGASISRYPLEGYRERCATNVTIGTRFSKKPVELKIPITIAGMSFGSLSANAKEALGRAASEMGTSTTTGDGGMTEEERRSSKTLVYQVLPSRYGHDPDHMRRCEAIEVVVGQGAKPGGGGMLLGLKVTERVAGMRTLPVGIDQRSACRHPDWTGPDDLEIKIAELREVTDWEKPIYVKVGATRVKYDVALAVKSGADAVVVDGMQGGTGATQEVFIEHVGIPTLPAVRQAVGADAVSIGTAALIALNCNAPLFPEDYAKLGTAPGYCHHCHTGRCPVGVTTQDPDLEARLDPGLAAHRVRNYLSTMVLEAQTLARACGKSHLHNLEPEDLVALTIEAAAMAGVPLAGTDWIPGRGGQ
jgi:methylamine---glutamate N-methyltransferase subunit C